MVRSVCGTVNVKELVCESGVCSWAYVRVASVRGLVYSLRSALVWDRCDSFTSLGAEFFGLDFHFPLQKGAGTDLTGG